jgi:outer membrane protein TolC
MRVAGFVALGLALLSARGAAEELVGIRTAMRLASARAPAVQAAEAASLALAAAERVANPWLLLPGQLQLIAGSRSFPGDGGAGFEASAQFLQPIPLRALGAARARVVRSARELAAARADEARLVIAERAAHAWIDATAAERALALRRGGLDEAKGLTRLARARVESGIAEPDELALALADEALAESEVLDEEGRRTEARLSLAALVGVDERVLALDETEAPFERAPPAVDEAIRALLTRHPALARARIHGQTLALEADYVHAQHGSTLGVGAIAAREGSREVLSGAMLSLPLSWSSPGQSDFLRARAEADEAELFRSVEEQELTRHLRVAIHEHTHTREVLEAARRSASALEHAYRLARARFARGASDVARASIARQRLIASEARTVRAQADVTHASVRLAALTGSLSEGPTR